MSAISGPVPRGLRVAFVVLTLAAAALAVVAGLRGVWFLTVICGVFAVLNLGVLWTTRAQSGAGAAAGSPAPPAAGSPAPPADETSRAD